MSREDIEQAIYSRTGRFVPEDVQLAISELIYAATVAGAEAEREACAKVCETLGDKKEGHSIGYRSAAWECAATIRARGNHVPDA